ncbi:MAG: hypothetical protein ACXWC4_14950 [Telluria sp.]
MMLNRTEKHVRTVSRSQIVRFYLWSLQQRPGFKMFGCAAMFTYLTGFRAAEVRPFHVSGIVAREGVRVVSAKRKKGEPEQSKLREWSVRLRVVVERARQTHEVGCQYLFANGAGRPYTRSGWGASWTDAMFDWIASFDDEVARHLSEKRAVEARNRVTFKRGGKLEECEDYSVTTHPAYFSLQDIRPAAITTKLRRRDVDAYDFAAHANPATTHQHYDRRRERRARATE